jgi:AraC-like DNA-binding protein/AmiR/NasT family two-component response regulator
VTALYRPEDSTAVPHPNRMERLRLLWIRVLRDSERATPRSIAEEFFQVEVCEDIHAAAECMKRFAPRAVCWEYEEADAIALRAMRDFKLANPALPILMLTGQHSESLAVWAFRARVWNYLIKPVAKSELRANFTMLAELLREDRGPARAVRQLRGLLPGEYAAKGAGSDGSVLRSAIVSVERHYSEKLRQSAVAVECGMTSSAFSRAFKGEYGLTFSEYLMRFRIGQACYLLRLGSHSATSAGVAVGFDDASHFARAFRKVMGMSPSLYKRQKAAVQGAEQRQRRRAALRGALMRHRDPRGPSEVASALRDQEKSPPGRAERVR